jgi:tripartite-type tricarboxylate transporter receptor subunit TctC
VCTLITWLALLLLSTLPAAAQGWPDRAVRMVVPYAAGGSTDTTARLVAEGLRRDLGQSFVVENRPGAGGAIGHAAVAVAPADGYTLLFSAAGPLTVTPHTTARLSYDPIHAFAPIKLVAGAPLLLLVRPGVGINDLPGLLATIARMPSGMSYGSFGIGSAAHLAGEMFRAASGATLVHVPYTGSAPALNALMAGDTGMMFDVLASSVALVQGGRPRALAVTAPARSPLLPDVPTMAEAGFPGFEAGTWFGLLAPTGTPKAVISVLDRAMDEVMRQPEFQQAMIAQGLEVMGGSPQRFADFFQAEFVKWGQAAQGAGLRPN